MVCLSVLFLNFTTLSVSNSCSAYLPTFSLFPKYEVVTRISTTMAVGFLPIYKLGETM